MRVTAFDTPARQAVDDLANRVRALLGEPAVPGFTLVARLSFRQWADAVDAGRMPVIRALLRETALDISTFMEHGK